jgi:hypothetical protein
MHDAAGPCGLRRALDEAVRGPGCTLQSFAEAFRGVCDAAILQSVAEGTQRAQGLSLVLDYGNQRITALERSSGASTSASISAPAAPQQPASSEDPFWAADMPDLSALLSLQVRKGFFSHEPGLPDAPRNRSIVGCSLCRPCEDWGRGGKPRCRVGSPGPGRSGGIRW